jgi:flagellar hook capping protein FlgD
VAVLGTADQAESVFVTFDGAPGPRVRVLAGFRFDVRLRRFVQGTHTVVVQSEDKSGNLSPVSAPVSFVYQEELGVVVPERFILGHYLQVNLTKPGNAVLLRIYDLSGRLVKRLEDRSIKTVYEFAWDLSDQAGNPVGSGPYIVGVEADYTDGSKLSKRLAMVVTR